jgi:hypothetical protein
VIDWAKSCISEGWRIPMIHTRRKKKEKRKLRWPLTGPYYNSAPYDAITNSPALDRGTVAAKFACEGTSHRPIWIDQ